MGITNKVRLTAVAILPENQKNDNIPGYIDKVLAGEDPAVIRTICRTAEIAPEDIDTESTTKSFPVDLFRSGSEDDADETIMPVGMRASFGSDTFWKWFDKAAK